MRRTTRILSCFCVAWAAFSLAAAGQSTETRYRKLVDDYRRYGASAVPRAVALTDDEIVRGRTDLAGFWEEQRAAAILHTEATLTLLNDRQISAAREHGHAAADLLEDVVRAVPAQREFAYRWYALADPLMRKFGDSGLANELSRRATVQFSAEFLNLRRRYDDAVLFELQGSLRGSQLSAIPAGMTASTLLLPRWFNPASQTFDEILKADPDLLGAALHLGRMQMIDGSAEKAAQYLERARGATDPRVKYLATLFLGSLDERSGRLVEAEKRYREALVGYGWGQAAHLALSQLLARTGREVEARRLVMDRVRDRVIEPLWTYLAGPSEELGARFDELRAEVWR